MLRGDLYMNSVSKKVLLIDNSNSRTKFLLSVDGTIASGMRMVPTADLSFISLSELLIGFDYEAVIVCSVVPESRRVFERYFECPLHFVSAHSSMEMLFDYPGVATLGADRIAGCLGALSTGLCPVVVIDAGTAVAFDVVDQRNSKPTYIGGTIAPGLRAFTEYMHCKTALLPEVTLNMQARAIASGTVEAIQAGALFGFTGMVNGILNRICSELGYTPRIVVTGGDSGLIVNNLNYHATVDELLVFRGLASLPSTLF